MLSELEQAKIELADAVLKSLRVRQDYRIMPTEEVDPYRQTSRQGCVVRGLARRVENLMPKADIRKMGLR